MRPEQDDEDHGTYCRKNDEGKIILVNTEF